VPAGDGGKYYAEKDGLANLKHKGAPEEDTADFSDRVVGNVRVDYVLPSKGMTITNQGVFWPTPDEKGNNLSDASDHRMVWIDVSLEQEP
jgi:hypothetical protein